MSVYIKGMKAPEQCFYCKHQHHGWCGLLPYSAGRCPYNGKHPDCPVIPVPDHGDLIDRDALRQEMRISDSCSRCERDAYRCQYYDEMTVMDVCGRIDDMPVVIPAERSEDHERTD